MSPAWRASPCWTRRSLGPPCASPSALRPLPRTHARSRRRRSHNRWRCCAGAYRAGWAQYLSGFKVPAGLSPAMANQYRVALMVLGAFEDKRYRGAMIASLAVPWGEAQDASQNVGGYHLVWARDLYHVALALLAAGNREAPARALDYLFAVQQRPDGTFPQNSWLDGRAFWGSLQLDEVAVPILLAHALGKGRVVWEPVRRAADALLRLGPSTPQERWEEQRGYSPASLAAEVAGLLCASEIAEQSGDKERGRVYRAVADEWQRRIEDWTVTTNGPHGKRYYVRIAQMGRPNAGEPLEVRNGGGTRDERDVVDAGFLELVRLGVRPASDPVVASSLEVVDRLLRRETPAGISYYRYNHDGYGEPNGGAPWASHVTNGVGRLWPLLTGERGEYALARSDGEGARQALTALGRFANSGLMIPEQVWDRPVAALAAHGGFRHGEGTGSATPLAWTMAGFVRLAVGIERGAVFGTPELVAKRYARAAAQRPARARLEASRVGSRLVGRSDATHVTVVGVGPGSNPLRVAVSGGRFAVEWSDAGPAYVVAERRDGATAAIRVDPAAPKPRAVP